MILAASFPLLLILWTSLPFPCQVQASSCPAPFQLDPGSQLCLHIHGTSANWCGANRLCAQMGGELINSPESLTRLRTSNITIAYDMWTGVNDLESEAGNVRSGWQRVNGRGILPKNDSLWRSGEPSGMAEQNCARFPYVDRRLCDGPCSTLMRHICEYVPPSSPPTHLASLWQKTNFKRDRNISDYCYADLTGPTVATCVTRAVLAGSSGRAVLHNSRTGACRLLQFTDSTAEPGIEYGQDWVKFVRV